MDAINSLARMLCAVAMVSAVAEVLLAGRKGSEIVCLMLSLAGVGSILVACSQIWIKPTEF